MLVGGSRGTMYGNIIQDFFTKAADWPRGAALAVVMLVATLLLVVFAARLVKVKAARMTASQSAISEQGRFSLLTGYFVGLIALLYLPLAVLFLPLSQIICCCVPAVKSRHAGSPASNVPYPFMWAPQPEVFTITRSTPADSNASIRARWTSEAKWFGS